jgi:hypothetical protein
MQSWKRRLRGRDAQSRSEGEAERALAIAERLGRTPRLAIRVNPDFDLKGSGMKMGGGAKPFGIDAASAGAGAPPDRGGRGMARFPYFRGKSGA